MTQNLARQARDTVATFLGRDVTQEAFAYFVNSAVGTVRGWEQSRRIPRGTATHTLLSLIVQSPESMVPAIVQVHLSERLRFEVSFDLASEFVNLVLRGKRNGTRSSQSGFSYPVENVSCEKEGA